MGALRCWTGPDVLSRRVDARFSCGLQLFSDVGQIDHHVGCEVVSRPPWVRLRTPPPSVPHPHT